MCRSNHFNAACVFKKKKKLDEFFFLSGGVNANEFIIKSCASPDECVQGSVNFGNFRSATVSQCCDTDLCNNQTGPGKVSVSRPFLFAGNKI